MLRIQFLPNAVVSTLARRLAQEDILRCHENAKYLFSVSGHGLPLAAVKEEWRGLLEAQAAVALCFPGAPFIISKERNELPTSLEVHAAKTFLWWIPSLGNKWCASAFVVFSRKYI